MQSRPAGDRRRRIIYNNDGDDLAIVAYRNSEGSETKISSEHPYPHRYQSVDEFLGKRMKGKIDGTQVDSIFYCGFAGEPNWEFPSKNLSALGPDPLKHVVDYAHENGMEFVYSLRMNDIHHAVHTGSYRWSPFRRKNLHLLQGNVDGKWFDRKVWPWARGLTGLYPEYEHPLAEVLENEGHLLVPGAARSDRSFPLTHPMPSDFRAWAAYDYAHTEVQDYILQVVERACERYDLDGIEFDWGNTPVFKAGVERRNAPVMTDFVCRVRQYLNARGQERGRPILLATRVPASPVQSLAAGLDAETWIREGWVDILVAGFGNEPFSFPLADWVRVGHESGVQVYGCINNDGLFGSKPEATRATASRYWSEGVDGIYLYNHFYEDTHVHGDSKQQFLPEYIGPVLPQDTLHDIGDPDRLERQDKLYRVDVYGPSPQLPLAFANRGGPTPARLRLEIADQPEKAARVTVQTKWKSRVDSRRATWRLNGESLSNPRPIVPDGDGEGWIEFETNALNNGVNTFEVTVQPPNKGTPPGPLVLQQLQVSITYS